MWLATTGLPYPLRGGVGVETGGSAGADFDGLSTAANPTGLSDCFLSLNLSGRLIRKYDVTEGMYRTNHICTVRADMSRFVTAAFAHSPVEGDAARSSLAISSADGRASSCPCNSLFAGSVDSDCESFAISSRKTGDGRAAGNDVS